MDSLARHLTPDGELSFTRMVLHAAIIDELLHGQTRNLVFRVTFTAGGPASGKSAVIEQLGLAVNAVLIDVDRIRTMLPEYAQWHQDDPEHAASWTHREASELAKRVFAAALLSGVNVVFDGVGDDDSGKFSERISATLEHTPLVQVCYATVPVDLALERERTRFERTGRRVPGDVLRHGHGAASRGLRHVTSLPVFKIEIYDTSGETPRLVAYGPGGKGLDGLCIVDPAGYAEFLSKGET